MGWIFPKWIRLFWICKLLSDKLWCKEYRKTNSTGTVQHLYTSIPVGGTAGRFDFLYWNLRRRGAGNAYRNLCRQWSDDPLWTSSAVYVHQFPILAEPFLWIWTMVRKRAAASAVRKGEAMKSLEKATADYEKAKEKWKHPKPDMKQI